MNDTDFERRLAELSAPFDFSRLPQQKIEFTLLGKQAYHDTREALRKALEESGIRCPCCDCLIFEQDDE